jgi:hypothetical protein
MSMATGKPSSGTSIDTSANSLQPTRRGRYITFHYISEICNLHAQKEGQNHFRISLTFIDVLKEGNNETQSNESLQHRI